MVVVMGVVVVAVALPVVVGEGTADAADAAGTVPP